MKKRKIPKRPSFQGRPVLPKLQAIALKLNHPLVLQDADIKPFRQNREPELVKRTMCFSRIPSCCLYSIGHGANIGAADESAAHAMLDFFRLAISPAFADQLLACENEEAVLELATPINHVFQEYEKAMDADYMSIKRCSQFEMTSATILRGKELKKRVLLNLKDPLIGYAPKNSQNPPAGDAEGTSDSFNTPKDECTETSVIKDEEPSQSVVKIEETSQNTSLNNGTSAENPVILDDDELSSSSDIIVVEDAKKTPRKPKNMDTPKKEQKISSKSPSPELETFREYDELQKRRIHENQDRQNLRYRRSGDREYFGEANTSNSGPPEVFCCLPNQNRTEFAEAQSSDESEDEGENEVPRKRARPNDEDDDVIVLNMTSSAPVPEEAAASGDASNGREEQDRDQITDSDEEIGDIVDEWNETDEDNVEEVEKVVKEKEEEEEEEEAEVTTTTAPNGSDNGFYDGHSTHQAFMNSRRLPFNYQAKTIGVVVNETLCRQLEKYVDSVTDKHLDCVQSLSRLSWVHYEGNIQDNRIYDLKARARDLLHQEIQKVFPEKMISLHITGSTINGCGAYNSDMDMCLCYPIGYRGTSVDDFQCEKAHSVKVLRKLDKAIRRCRPRTAIRLVIARCKLIPAKVPIIKCDLTQDFHHLDVDINVNNIAGIYNSHLTHYYSLIDARFPALALLIKHWAFVVGVNNACDGYLNSYSIILLVVHYLQCGVSPAILPNLQYLFPDKFDRKIPLHELRLFGNIVESLPTSPPNKWSLGELVIGFFYYYSEFDFKTKAISIRSAQVIPRSCLPRDTINYPIFVEEPFDAVNTARTVRSSNMNLIKSEFRKACNTLSPRRRFNVEDIGVTVRE